MKGKMRTKRQKVTEEEIDRSVVAEANEPSAWSKPVRVRKPKARSLSIPVALAERAAFLARLHREPAVEHWLARIIRERIELEENAYAQARRDLVAKR